LLSPDDCRFRHTRFLQLSQLHGYRLQAEDIVLYSRDTAFLIFSAGRLILHSFIEPELPYSTRLFFRDVFFFHFFSKCQPAAMSAAMQFSFAAIFGQPRYDARLS
jgi:hypothetical protein